MARRGRIQIWVDILSAVEAEAANGRDRVRPTRVQSAANVPHERFWAYAAELEAHGLLQVDPLRLTPDGDAFLQQTHHFHEFVRRFGIEAPFCSPAAEPPLPRRQGPPSPGSPVPFHRA